jgi:hypothetical protein
MGNGERVEATRPAAQKNQKSLTVFVQVGSNGVAMGIKMKEG